MQASVARTQRFVDRVQAFHDNWADVRHASILTAHSDRQAQFEALRLVYTWCTSAAADIATVYGPALAVALSDLPDPDDYAPVFVLSIDERHAMIVSLEPLRGDASQWHVVVSRSSPGMAHPVAVAPARKTPHWTRRLIEDAILSLLASIERSRPSPVPLPWSEEVTATSRERAHADRQLS